MADRTREKLENDPSRDMTHVPGTYNPGNQAGKDVQGGGLTPAGEPGAPFLGKGAGKAAPNKPGQTGTPSKDPGQNQKR